MHFVTTDVARKVLEACPSLEWKLIFALARWGGLWTPSETLELKWGDIRLDIGRIRVTVPKLAHLEAHGERWVPLFPELRPLLAEAFEQAVPGTEFVVCRTRDQGANLRTQMHRIIRTAGETPWPKVFQNCRSTRTTELAGRHPAHVCAAWLGHSVEIGERHYMQVTDQHFADALKDDAHSDARPAGNLAKWAESSPSKSENTGQLAGFSRNSIPPSGFEPLLPG